MQGNGNTRTDEELAQEASEGDEEAARELFERHVRTLRARVRARLPHLIRGKVGDSDVVQEAYLAAFLRLSDFEDRGPGSFSRWLGKILENKIGDEVRRYLGTGKRSVRREEPQALTGSGSSIPHKGGTPGSEAAAAEERARTLAAMEHVSPADREILRCVHERRLAFTEIAVRLDVTPDAARRRYGRALARLARILSPEGENPR